MINHVIYKAHENVAFNELEENYDIDETIRNLTTD